jgi:hypothetical protein
MSAPRPSDRRSVPRHPCPLETYCRACSISDDDLWWRGEIWDVSIAGVGLILTRSFETGSNLEIEVPLANVRTLAVHVEYVTQQVDGSWFLGCTFLDRLDDATVKAIVELTAAATASA